MELTRGIRNLIGFATTFIVLVLLFITIMTFWVVNDAASRVKKAEWERDSVNNVYFNHLKEEH